MKRALLGSFAKMTMPEFNLMNDEGFTATRLWTEILSGLTVALALVPEAVAFAFVAGVHPLVGLYAAFLVGLITAFIGGRPGMISGATGALAVVMVALVAKHGVEYFCDCCFDGHLTDSRRYHAFRTFYKARASPCNARICERARNCYFLGSNDPV